MSRKKDVELLRREVLIGTTTSIFATFSQIIFMAYLGIHLENLLASALIIGIVFGIRNVIQIVFRIPIGEFSQVIGRKPLILMGLIFYTTSFIFMYLSKTWSTVAFATFLLGIGMSFYYPSLFAYIGDISGDNYGKINGYFFQGSDIAIIIGAFSVSEALDRGLLSLEGVFLLCFVVGIFGVLITYTFLPESLKPASQLKPKSRSKFLLNSITNSFSSFKLMTSKKNLRTIYFYQMVIAFTEFFFQSFIGLYIVLSAGYQDEDVTRIIAIGTLILLPLKPFLGSISDKFGYRLPVILALFGNAILIATLSFLTNYDMIIILYSFVRAISVMSYLAINGATSYNASEKDRGVAMGTLGVYVSIGRTLSSIILGITWEYLNSINRNSDGVNLLGVFRIASVIIIYATLIVTIFFPKPIAIGDLETSIDISGNTASEFVPSE